MTLHAIIQSLHAVSGNNDKQAILDANKDNVSLKAYMKAVMDPAVNYYQTKLPKLSKSGLNELNAGLLNVLHERLAQRSVTGNEAKKWLKWWAEDFTEEHQVLIEYIIKRKLGSSKVGESMVLRTWRDLFFVPPYMRCSAMSTKVVEHYKALLHFIVQPKRDGSFAYGIGGNDGKQLCTRAGNFYPAWFAEQVLTGIGTDIVLAGELEVYQNLPDSSAYKLLDRKTGNGILNSITEDNASEVAGYVFKYVAWDCLTLDEWYAGASGRPYSDRLDDLDAVLDPERKLGRIVPHVVLIESHEVDSVGEAFAINTDITTRGGEGTVWKTMSGKWRDSGSGTKDMVKLKVKFQADYDVIGYYEGEGKAAGMLGGITVATKDRKLISNCGTGFSDEARVNLWKLFNEHGVDGLIAEIEANDVIDNKDRPGVLALSLPVFMELRRDKKDADTLERVIEQRDAARMGK